MIHVQFVYFGCANGLLGGSALDSLRIPIEGLILLLLRHTEADYLEKPSRCCGQSVPERTGKAPYISISRVARPEQIFHPLVPHEEHWGTRIQVTGNRG